MQRCQSVLFMKSGGSCWWWLWWASSLSWSWSLLCSCMDTAPSTRPVVQVCASLIQPFSLSGATIVQMMFLHLFLFFRQKRFSLNSIIYLYLSIEIQNSLFLWHWKVETLLGHLSTCLFVKLPPAACWAERCNLVPSLWWIGTEPTPKCLTGFSF